MRQNSKKTSNLTQSFLSARKTTLDLIKRLNSEDMVIQTKPFVSPIKWHLAHTTWFFENFILKKIKKYKLFDSSYDYIFNSYYNSVGRFNPKDMRGYLNRPSINKIFEYRKYIDQHLVEIIEKSKFDNRINEMIKLGINHEQQHQELILMDVKNIFFCNPLKPQFIKKRKIKGLRKSNLLWKSEEKVRLKFGREKDEIFFYDNESGYLEKELPPYEISIDFISNSEWREFIESDGYKRPELWLSDGWNFINKYGINKPMYWLDLKNHFTLAGVEKLEKDQPVSHISFYEAIAFCNYKKKRLPTEFEMEFFLEKNKKEGNFLESKYFRPINYFSNNKGNKPFGNLWLWTSSNYIPFDGYKPYKGNLGEYNQKFMCNQFVLKGGSFATPKSHIRSSYRNFYYPSDRWHFCGIRLASDIIE